MSVAHDLIIDQLSSTADGSPHLATWYAQGHSDALGDRLLMFDNTSAPSWEILRFKPALARDHRFEAGLRERMEQLASFNHPAFPLVRPLKGLGHEDGLAAVSTYSPGLRLSEAMKKPRSAAFAVRLLRQLAPGLAALQEHAPGIFHGALDADRIVVTAEGRLTVREHMVGAAIARLEMSAEKLWEDFHLVAPRGGVAGYHRGVWRDHGGVRRANRRRPDGPDRGIADGGTCDRPGRVSRPYRGPASGVWRAQQPAGALLLPVASILD